MVGTRGASRRQRRSESHGSSGQRRPMVLNQRRGLHAPRGSARWRGERNKEKKELKVKKGKITVVLKFFEMDSWGQVKDE